MNFYLTCIKHNIVGNQMGDFGMHIRPGEVISVASIEIMPRIIDETRPQLCITTEAGTELIMEQDSFKYDYIYTVENRDDIKVKTIPQIK